MAQILQMTLIDTVNNERSQAEININDIKSMLHAGVDPITLTFSELVKQYNEIPDVIKIDLKPWIKKNGTNK